MSKKRFATSLIFLLLLLRAFSTLCPAADDSSFAIIGDTRIGKAEKVTEKEPYYSVAHNDTLFLLLNTELPGQEGRITGGGGAPLHTFSEDYGGFMHYIVAKKRNGGYVLSAFDFKGTVRDEFSLRK